MALTQGFVHGTRMLCRSAHGVIIMCQIRVDRNKLQDIQNPLEEIAKYVFLKPYYGVYVSRSFGFCFFFLNFCVDMPYDLSRMAEILMLMGQI